jgi:hypothetical protein
VTKLITLTGLSQVDELSNKTTCMPVEDVTMSGEKVIRCKEDVMELDKIAPVKVATLSGVETSVRAKRPRKRRTVGHRLGSTDRACVPEWVALRLRSGKTSRRCHCGNRFFRSSICERKRG